MRSLAKLTRLAVLFFQLIFRPFPVRKRAVFVSYFSTKPEGNMACVLEAMRGKAPIVTLFATYGRGFSAKLRYVRHTLREIWYFSTSSLIVLEGNSFTLANMQKKKGITAVQLWHAAGAYKKFGADTERLYDISGLDAALVSCPAVREIYSHALSVPIEGVFAVGIPRADAWSEPDHYKKARAAVEAEYPALRGKRIALYAPTFRGKGIDDVHAPGAALGELAECGYELAVRMHPMLKDDCPGYPDFSRFDLMTALAAADVLITDYSSIIFEYSLLGRPMIFYCPDRREYADERGFYFGFEDFVPGAICETSAQAAQALLSGEFEMQRLAAFREKFTYMQDGKASERAAELLMKML